MSATRMKLIGPPGTELRHILATYIMCPCDLDYWPIFPKIGSRDPEVLLHVCAYFEVHRRTSRDHGLYGSTSCCISHGRSQWERAIFDPHSSETPGPIFIKLEIYNYFPDTTPHATWVVWANSQFDAWKFLSIFSFLRHAHRSHFWTHPTAQYVIIRRFRQGSAFWGLERLNLKFDPLYAPKT